MGDAANTSTARGYRSPPRLIYVVFVVLTLIFASSSIYSVVQDYNNRIYIRDRGVSVSGTITGKEAPEGNSGSYDLSFKFNAPETATSHKISIFASSDPVRPSEYN